METPDSDAGRSYNLCLYFGYGNPLCQCSFGPWWTRCLAFCSSLNLRLAS